ncbi:MAG: tetratricopeptide repeat protein [Planctomycetia bacterium]|nr:tetratricopeptide repeat protein [Planctomycetia bacterium]
MTRNFVGFVYVTGLSLLLFCGVVAPPNRLTAFEEAHLILVQEEKSPDAAPEENSLEIETEVPENASDEDPGDDSAEMEGEALEEGVPEENDSVVVEEEDAVVSETEQELATVAASSADDLLNLATDLKLSATSVFDLTKVIMYCSQAEAKGLSEENVEFCRQLKVSTQLQRGLAIAKFFMVDDDTIWETRRGWQLQRKMALEDLEAAVADMPDVATAQLAIGRLQMLPEGDRDKAREAFDKAIECADNEPEVLAESLKYRAALEEDSQKQLDFYQRALELAPENANVLALMADHWLTAKNYGKALECIDKAIETEPDNIQFKKTKAFVLAADGQKEAAEKLFDEVLIGSEDDIMLQIEKGQFLLSLHEEAKAIEHFTKLIERYPQLPGLYYFRAIVYSQLKDYKKAHKDVNQCLRIDMEFSEALQLKAVLFLQEEKYKDAIRLFESMCRKKPGDVACVTQLAYAQAKSGDKDAAFDTLAKQLEKNPDDCEVLRCRGDIELMYGLWQETIATYDRLLELNPNDSGVLNNYAWLLATSPEDSVRDGKRALEYATKAAELSWFAEAHILSTLAAAYAELGDFDLALEWATKAIEIATREQHEKLEELQKEPESYKEKKPWREIPEMLREKKAQ